jgi:heat-inducible transcriptional repressor
VELVPLAPGRLLLVLITDTGRVEQRGVELPGSIDEDSIAHLRAVLNSCLDGRPLGDAAGVIGDLPAQIDPADRPNAAAVLSVLLESLVERHEEKIVFGGAANLTARDFSKGLQDVLEALEEQVVLMRLLGESGGDPSMLTVRIGAENAVEGLHNASIVSTGYGAGDQVLAKLAVLGPTRMDYPGTMGAVRAVARYVGQILAES